MAKIISPRILTPSTSLLPLPLKSLFPSQSLAISTKPIITPRFRRKPNRPSLMARASSTAAAVVPDDISDVLGEVSIFTAAGEPVQLKDLWDQQEGIAVVALLRHFGCFCCWELAASLKEAKEKLDSAGVKLIAVGVGTPDKAKLLGERLPFPMDSLYADPDRKAYDVLGLYYGFRRTFLNPASIKVFSRYEELKKAMKNYTIRATPDDTSSVLQQGGMFVFKGKQLLYARKDEGTGDHAPLDEILDICCKVPTP
ncbi:thioredoxin-like protein AAED1, chloroplastic isoform X1 [Salvia miltiorrhiza]|uniref:thioredoxin-like protein AAED1, chloroplastic isoform X1 n=1 Tax=Salvia miltiorrhiza TaxID=226208 RepID=UPI0025ABCE10|nr:thioredoxin-like protein AAED1, chloroplastic isoform X1 [Salvia miltiorrhiza]